MKYKIGDLVEISFLNSVYAGVYCKERKKYLSIGYDIKYQFKAIILNIDKRIHLDETSNVEVRILSDSSQFHLLDSRDLEDYGHSTSVLQK